MHPKKSKTTQSKASSSKEVEAIIKKAGGWKGNKLAELRSLIRKAEPDLVEEVKWKMPSKPHGVPVWSKNGIVCHMDILKHAVRLNFHQGAKLKDAHKLFNARMESKTMRAIDFGEDDSIQEAKLKSLIVEALRANKAKAGQRSQSPSRRPVDW